MLHRQWMKIRRSENSLCAYKEKILQFLRDAVLLLYSLSQKDKLFHEHCLEVLHQYDQAMPGIRAVLRKSQKLSACEGKMLFCYVVEIEIALLSLSSFTMYQRPWLVVAQTSEGSPQSGASQSSLCESLLQ